ncbi:hypothetical protein IJH26_00015 [Candidatus Saccharibacteria bacterium]|nr:hypothetical protein [Candidatus Saccharibacteria bacterium]
MKNYLLKIISILSLVSLSIAIINSVNVHASDDFKSSMFVTPMSQEISLIPGDTYEGLIKVSNGANAQENLAYSVKIGSYGWNNDEETPGDYDGINVNTKNEYNQIMDWITLDKENGTVEPNGVDQIKYTINVPDNAPAGAQYASILVVKDEESENNDKENNITMQSVFQIASAIIANVAGDTVNSGVIVDNSIPSFMLNGHLDTTSMVKNTGNTYTNAEYVLQVWPMSGSEEICTNEEKPEREIILPSTERYHVQSCDLPSIGIFRAKQTVKIFGEISTVEKTIIVCPLWLLFIVVFAIVSIIIWLVVKAKNRKNSR